MATYSRKEFAKLCGVSNSYLTVNIGRKKIVLNKKGEIDDKDPYNKEFYEKRKGNTEAPVLPAKEAQKKKKPKGDTSRDVEDPNDENFASISKFNLDLQIKELEVEHKTEQVRKLKLQNAKLVGETIPMDIVLLTMEHHFRSVSSAFYNAADNFIGTITTRLGAEKEEVAHIRKELIDIVNKSIQDGIKTSKKDVKKISQVYSEKRGKGESR